MNEIVQGSPEWHALRLGKATASRVADIAAKTKGGPSSSRQNYMAELIAERLTGEPAARFTNAAMEWGTATEPQARAAYEFYCDVDVAEIGFVGHPSIAMTGASPDGLVGADGLIEIKCPATSTHIDTLLGAPIPKKYLAQMDWQMECAGREWCDFVSFDPRLSEDMRIHIRRVERDAERIEELREAVITFLSELDEKLEKLKRLYRREAA